MTNDNFEKLLEEVADICKEWHDSPQLKGRLRLVMVQAINSESLDCVNRMREQPTDYAF